MAAERPKMTDGSLLDYAQWLWTVLLFVIGDIYRRLAKLTERDDKQNELAARQQTSIELLEQAQAISAERRREDIERQDKAHADLVNRIEKVSQKLDQR